MAELTSTELASLSGEIRVLRQTIENMSSLAGGTDLFKDFKRTIKSTSDQTIKEQAKELAFRKKIDAAYAESTNGILNNTKVMKKFTEGNKDAASAAALASKHLDDFYGSLDADGLEKATAAFRKSLYASNSSLASQTLRVEDMIELQTRLRSEYMEEVKTLVKLRKAGDILEHELEDNARKLGLSVDQLTEDGIKELEEEIKHLAKATTDAREDVESTGPKFKQFGLNMLQAGSIAVAAFTPLLDFTRTAARLGADYDNLDAALMGMNPEEFMQLQKENRLHMKASNHSYNQFNDAITESMSGLAGFTGDTKDAARVVTQAYGVAAKLGLRGEEQLDFMKEQAKTFATLNKNMNITAEEFMGMNDVINSSTDIQGRMYKLNTKQRRLYLQEIYDTNKRLEAMGLEHEARMEIIQSMAKDSNKPARERIVKAAGLEAMMGQLGLGHLAKEAGNLLRTGQTTSARWVEIQKEIQARYGEATAVGPGGNVGREMAFQQMAERLGLEEFVGPQNDYAKLSLEEGKAHTVQLQHVADLNAESNSWLNDIFRTMDAVGAFIAGPIFKTLGAIASGIGLLVTAVVAGKAVGGLLGRMGGKGGGAGRAGKIKGLLGKGKGVLGALWEGGKGLVKGAAKRVPIAGAALAGGGASLLAANRLADRDDISEAEKNARIIGTGVGTAAGSTIGAGGGAMAGAALGSVVPVVGTAIGGVAGAIIGGLFGEHIGSWLGDKVGEKVAGGSAEPSAKVTAEVAKQPHSVQSKVEDVTTTLEQLRKESANEGIEYFNLMKEQLRLDHERHELQKKTNENTEALTKETKKVGDKVEEQTKLQEQIHEDDKQKLEKGWRIQWHQTPRTLGVNTNY